MQRKAPMLFFSCLGKYGKSKYRKCESISSFPVTGSEMEVSVKRAKATGLWQQCPVER